MWHVAFRFLTAVMACCYSTRATATGRICRYEALFYHVTLLAVGAKNDGG